MDCASRCDPVSSAANPSGQSVTILSSLIPCAIAGAGKFPAPATAAASNMSRRLRLIILSSPWAARLRSVSVQRQPPGISVSGFRQLAPIHDTGEERHVAVVNLTGQRILRGDLGDDLLAD